MQRAGNHFMILALTILVSVSFVDCNFTNYFDRFKTEVDQGAAKTCYMLEGTLEAYNVDSITQGHKCTYTAKVWTKDDKAAHEFCASNAPFPVITDFVKSLSNGETACSFWITLKCNPDSWQIDGLCYKVLDNDLTFYDAKRYCQRMEGEDAESKLAEFYSTTLGMFLEHMMFSEAWVTVPYITEYFENGVGDAAVFVNDGAFKFDTKQGTLILRKEYKKHPALCQYKPALTTAEVYRRAKEFEEIYPIYAHNNGINIATSSYLTVHQADGGKFDAEEIREHCKALGKIMDVKSFPLAPTETDWNGARSYLKDHRFYLTGAFKNLDGCKLTDYRYYDASAGSDAVVFRSENADDFCNAFSFSLNEDKRAASMAGMRAPVICALHSYSFKTKCPPGWIGYVRSSGYEFCHYIYHEKEVTLYEARAACREKNAALSGFDSEEELATVWAHTDQSFCTHYWLGGVVPCAKDCHPGYMASWEEGVAQRHGFLNHYNHSGHGWSNMAGNDAVSFRGDYKTLHTHNSGSWRTMFYICGKYQRSTSTVPLKITRAQ